MVYLWSLSFICIPQIVDKALEEPKYSSLYAQLCLRLAEDAPNFDGPSPEIQSTQKQSTVSPGRRPLTLNLMSLCLVHTSNLPFWSPFLSFIPEPWSESCFSKWRNIVQCTLKVLSLWLNGSTMEETWVSISFFNKDWSLLSFSSALDLQKAADFQASRWIWKPHQKCWAWVRTTLLLHPSNISVLITTPTAR